MKHADMKVSNFVYVSSSAIGANWGQDKVAQNSSLFFLRLIELGAIFRAWNCTVMNGFAIF